MPSAFEGNQEFIGQGGELNANQEAVVLALTNLAVSGAAEAIRKSGTTSFENVALSTGNGTVTSISVSDANGVSATITNPTTTPSLTFSLGSIAPSAVRVSGLTASEILITDASKNLVSAPVATYPSLTELTYVKGVTSALQTQLDAKLALAGGTMTGVITLGQNAAIALDPAGSADGKYTGITVTGTGGTTIAFGDLIYLDPTDSRWELCDANAASGADGDSRGIIGIAVTASSDGGALTVLLHGIVRADTAFPAMTVNAPMYISETAGDITGTKPTTTDNVVRVVGFALTGDELFFSPESGFITHV